MLDAHFRIAETIWLAVSLTPPCPKLVEFLDDVDAKELSEIIGVKILPSELEGDDYRDVISRMKLRDMNGFLIHAEVPIPIMLDGPLAHISNLVSPGVVRSRWFYFETLDHEVIGTLTAWKDEVIRREKIRQDSEKKVRGLVAIGKQFRKAFKRRQA